MHGSGRISVCEKEKARTGGHGEAIEVPICGHCHGYCRNDSASGRSKREQFVSRFSFFPPFSLLVPSIFFFLIRTVSCVMTTSSLF